MGKTLDDEAGIRHPAGWLPCSRVPSQRYNIYGTHVVFSPRPQSGSIEYRGYMLPSVDYAGKVDLGRSTGNHRLVTM